MWQRMLAVNVTGAFLTLREGLRQLDGRGWGRLITVASTAGLKGYAYVSAYSAAKHGAVGLRARHQLGQAARAHDDEIGLVACLYPSVPVEAHHVGGSRCHRTRPVGAVMVEMQDARGLAEDLDHVEIAIGVERVANVQTVASSFASQLSAILGTSSGLPRE